MWIFFSSIKSGVGIGVGCRVINAAAFGAMYAGFMLGFFPQLKKKWGRTGSGGGVSCEIINAALYAG